MNYIINDHCAKFEQSLNYFFRLGTTEFWVQVLYFKPRFAVYEKAVYIVN